MSLNWLYHKPPEVLQSQVFCFWFAGGILTTQATLTQWAWISTFIVDLRAEKIAAKFVMVGLPDEDSIRWTLFAGQDICSTETLSGVLVSSAGLENAICNNWHRIVVRLQWFSKYKKTEVARSLLSLRYSDRPMRMLCALATWNQTKHIFRSMLYDLNS